MPTADACSTTIDSDIFVARLQRPDDDEAWSVAEARYGPLVAAHARRKGLSASLAQDARQEVMLAFLKALRAGRFDPARGRLRDLLFGIARYHILALREREQLHARRFVQPDESGFLRSVPDRSLLPGHSETAPAVRARCLLEAQRHFSAKTYKMFYERAILRRPTTEVASKFASTPAAVHMAVHHVRTFLREIRPIVEDMV